MDYTTTYKVHLPGLQEEGSELGSQDILISRLQKEGRRFIATDVVVNGSLDNIGLVNLINEDEGAQQ